MAEEDIDRDRLVDKLISSGYERSSMVEEPGDFSIRGGIFDIFSPLYSDPIRIELFGDTVESIRFFSAVTQRTVKSIREAVILPARETILKSAHLTQVINRIRKQSSKLDIPVTRARDLIHRIRKDGVFPGIESLIPLIYPNLDSFFDYVPKNACFILVEPSELENIAEHTLLQASKSFDAAQKESLLCVEPERLYLTWQETKTLFEQKKTLSVKKLHVSKETMSDRPPPKQFHFSVKDNSDISLELGRRRGKDLFSPLANWINHHRLSGFDTLMQYSDTG